MKLINEYLVKATDRTVTHDLFLSATTVEPTQGVALVYVFPNGYGASILKCYGSHGYRQNLWELAVLGQNGMVTYDTPITDDVVGYLRESEVGEYLDRIYRLEDNK